MQDPYNNDSGNGLALSGNKPLPETMLTNITDMIWQHEAMLVDCNKIMYSILTIIKR